MGKAGLVRSAGVAFARTAVSLLTISSASTLAGLAASSPGVCQAADAAAFPPTAPAKDRSGVVVGLVAGLGLAGASGYPYEASKIDDPSYYSSSDLLTGGGGSGFVMGALTDYVSFGFWFGAATFESAHWRSTGGGGGVRLELFPLYDLVPKLKDLGVAAQLGFGTSKLAAKVGDYPSANGAQSYASLGAFYEVPLFKLGGGHLAAGPSLTYDAIFSPAFERHWAMLGARVVFYGGT